MSIFSRLNHVLSECEGRKPHVGQSVPLYSFLNKRCIWDVLRAPTKMPEESRAAIAQFAGAVGTVDRLKGYAALAARLQAVPQEEFQRGPDGEELLRACATKRSLPTFVLAQMGIINGETPNSLRHSNHALRVFERAQPGDQFAYILHAEGGNIICNVKLGSFDRRDGLKYGALRDVIDLRTGFVKWFIHDFHKDNFFATHDDAYHRDVSQGKSDTKGVLFYLPRIASST